MIVRYLEERIGSEYDVDTPTWNSRRLLLKEDGTGFSLHDTIIKAGTETMIWYKHHVEAVYCIEGEGEIELADSGEKFKIRPGMMYVLDGHEKHWLRSITDMRMVCVFDPPCTGSEVHDEDGAYAASSEREDAYPTRKFDKPALLERQDPIVYPAAVPQQEIDNTKLAFYEENGFLFLESFFDEEEVRRFKAETKRLLEENRGLQKPEVILEPDEDEVRSIFAVHEQAGFFRELAAHPRLRAIVERILGSEAYVHQSRINFKPGFTGKEFYWHSDFETWHAEDGMPRMRALSCSIALEDNTYYNGALMVVPGSHRVFVSCVGKTPDNHYEQSLRRQEYGVPDQESLTRLVDEGGIEMPVGKAGSVLLFDCNLMHGSSGNISPLPRSNAFYVFNSVENRLEQPFAADKPRPGFIATR